MKSSGEIGIQFNDEALVQYDADEKERIQSFEEAALVQYDVEKEYSTADEVTFNIIVADDVLRRTNIKLEESSFKRNIPKMMSQEEMFKANNEEKLKISDELINDFIEKNTTSNNHYSDPVFLGMRESDVCGYKLFDYSARNGSRKTYLTSFIYDDNTKENKVRESTTVYSDSSCEISDIEDGKSQLDLSSNKMDSEIYEQLLSISEDELQSYIDSETTEYTHYLESIFEYSLLVNNHDIAFVYSNKETGRYSEENIYFYVYLENIYVEDDKIIDYYLKDISTHSGEGLSIEEAYGEEYSTSDKIEKTIEFS